MNKDKIILDLCGGTGASSKPYKDNGYTVYNITLPDYDITQAQFWNDELVLLSEEDNDEYIKYKDIYGILAAPPCTQFSFARTTAKISRDLKAGMKIVIACLNIIWECRYKTKLAFWALENPMGYLRQFLGNPKYTFQPCWFGHGYTKKTDIWGYFNIPEKNPVKLNIEQLKKCKINNRDLPGIKGLKQSDKRAITPSGFAQAFYKANN